ncbi:hypothetical protein [Oryzomonas rubra]|uniref:Uncharacterized protein n=1 Tax=Oryzomonas rubra TaxID=2509454 RepID=A0A5A9XL39_9BACT|nr:hypothetical protein [Oryzomonas rubra]KAA0892251.1 hypothetical protein ET418_08630 [Oryzomonas rubra]
MQQDSGKGRQEVSLVGRILSLETMLLLMGVASLVYGIVNGVETSILWGVVIIPGVFILMKVRKKDWQKHWQDLEAEQKAHGGQKNPPSDPPREK